MGFLKRIENLSFLAVIIGVSIGIFFPQLSPNIQFLGDIFLQVLKMVILPLILSSIFIAIAKQEKNRELSLLGSKTLFYYISTTSLACFVGILASELLPNTRLEASYFGTYDSTKMDSITFQSLITSFFPSNIFKSLNEGNIVHIVVFSLFISIGALHIENSKRQHLCTFFEAIHDIMMKLISGILWFAPLGIVSLVSSMVAHFQKSTFAGLGYFFLAVSVAAIIHSLVTLPLIGYFFGKFNPYRFIYQVREALLVSFVSASSAAAIPVSKRVLEENAYVSPKTTRFVIPLGASLNMDGSALYQAIVILFLGTLAGIDFTFTEKIITFIFVILSSSGTAGIPGGGLLMIGATLQVLGIPLEYIGIYLLVDRFWDYPITAINVLGDLFAAKTIDRFVKKEELQANMSN